MPSTPYLLPNFNSNDSGVSKEDNPIPAIGSTLLYRRYSSLSRRNYNMT